MSLHNTVISGNRFVRGKDRHCSKYIGIASTYQRKLNQNLFSWGEHDFKFTFHHGAHYFPVRILFAPWGSDCGHRTIRRLHISISNVLASMRRSFHFKFLSSRTNHFIIEVLYLQEGCQSFGSALCRLAFSKKPSMFLCLPVWKWLPPKCRFLIVVFPLDAHCTVPTPRLKPPNALIRY